MNKKIFTLLVGACTLAGSLFTVNAQTLPYSMKDHTDPNDVSFNDILTADTVKKLPANHRDHNFLLSITGLANPSGSVATQFGLNLGQPSQNFSYVLFVDSVAEGVQYLRIENLATLDSMYDFKYNNASSKFGVLRQALWCLDYEQLSVSGSNVTFDFTNMATGRLLEAPILSPQENLGKWDFPGSSFANALYKDTINLFDEDLIVSGWHFSQTYKHNQNLQTGMPLYSYVKTDSVLVMVLNDQYSYESPIKSGVKTTSGGFTATVKYVAVADLIADAAGNVKVGGVDNVLLFTLKKVNKFVMNANDWNAVRFGIDFETKANVEVTNQNKKNKYKNLFEEVDPIAYEVRDSLYHYGYMQFQHPTLGAGKDFLYVDTAWANEGNNQFLAFAWGERRDSTLAYDYNTGIWHDFGGFNWGDGFQSTITTLKGKPDSVAYQAHANGANWTSSVYWRLDSLIWSTVKKYEIQETNSLVNGSGQIDLSLAGANYTILPADQALWDEIITEAINLGATGLTVSASSYILTPGTSLVDGIDYIGGNYDASYLANIQMRNKFHQDSLQYIYTFYADSLMENQSKFRVVYDPFADSTFINVYQTRVAHPNYENGVANQTWPYWWENSFVIDPSCMPNGVYLPYMASTPPQRDKNDVSLMADMESQYRDNYDRIYSNSGVLLSGGTAYTYHGNEFGLCPPLGNAIAQADPHSFMVAYEKSRFSNMDKVMISTADTNAIYNEFYTGADVSAMSHMYGYSIRNISGGATESPYYRDSLLYVDIQSLTVATNKIITLDQLHKDGAKRLDTKISITYGPRCKDTEGVDRATIDNDLYLIRNEYGQYLCVPLWSIMDSACWVMPEAYEDPTRIPSYQWAVVNIRNTEHSPFRLINREFENVEYSYTYVYETNDHPFVIGGAHANANFNRNVVYSGVTKKEDALQLYQIPSENFSKEVEKLFPLSSKISFIRLGKTVKEDQLLGYKYVDPDSTVVDVYAFKYLHGLATGENARFLGWYGDDEDRTPKDTAVYAQFQSYYDKLYFDLQEMSWEEIYAANKDNKYNGHIYLTAENTASGKAQADFAGLYKKITNREYNYTNRDSLVFDRFGFYEPNVITDLKPMARQAYRLMLQDYYRWHPTIKGHYMVIGQQDKYILADRVHAVKKYVSGSGNVEGLFGIPHFYFRNTYFDFQHIGDDYFAMVQRLDTARTDLPDYEHNDPSLGVVPGYEDINEYLTMTFGSVVANKVRKQIESNHEFGVFVAQVEEAYTPLKMIVRGEGGKAISTFQLERDSDPIYRRFHVNEPSGNFYPEMKDQPDTLEFHVLNDGGAGFRLYENSGNYYNADMSDRFGASGGRVYNRENDGYGDFFRDSLGNVISFLGINHSTQYGHATNYAIYVDTAFVNRGTGWIKPQYMLVVDPYIPEECGVCNPATGDNEGANEDYVIGRYLFNTAMYGKAIKGTVYDENHNAISADKADAIELPREGTSTKQKGYYIKSDNYSKVQPIDPNKPHADINGYSGRNYLRNTEWERLAFSWAIHKGDTLYVLKGLEPQYNGNMVNDPKDVWETLSKEYGSEGKYVDFEKLINDNSVGKYWEAYYPSGNRGTGEMREYHNFRSMEAVKADGKTIGLQAMIRLDDNTHKDWVFSMRYIERRSDDFVIESETTDRSTEYGAVIRPGYGGWVKFDNEVPYITRSDSRELQIESYGAVFNVHRLTQDPVNNESVEGDDSVVKVIGGNGTVTVLNATGKKVVISNILGQTVVNAVLNSDNASVTVPAGVVIVAVEGEDAVKAVVK